jgi:tripartite-type tricarboxylate transporter receptor subunit TctC
MSLAMTLEGKTVRRLMLALAFAVFASIANAPAQEFPSRPITLGMPFAAGGGGDTLARNLAERMRVALGQPVIVENITGAGGSIGTGRVARAAPDGYSLILGGWATHVVNGAVLTLPYDVVKDFEPVAMVVAQPLLIVGNAVFPPKDLRELVAWLKANPDQASMGTSGGGSATHIAAIFFQKETGTRFAYVPYRGGGPGLQDLVGGQIHMKFELPANSLPLVRAGRINAYAATAKRRLTVAPDIPTVDEAGMPGFYISLWNAIWAPKDTSKPVVAKLNAAVAEALADPALRARLADLGLEIPPREEQTPEALGAYHKAEIEKWWPILKAANVKPE